MGAPTCPAPCLHCAPGLCDPAGPGWLLASLASRHGVQSSRHPQQLCTEGLMRAPLRSLRNPPTMSWGLWHCSRVGAPQVSPKQDLMLLRTLSPSPCATGSAHFARTF